MKVVLMTIYALLFFSAPVIACFEVFPSVEESVASSDTIVIGQGIEEILISDNGPRRSKTSNMKFKILETLKGNKKNENIIEVLTDIGVCIRKPEVGGTYLLYVSKGKRKINAFYFYYKDDAKGEEDIKTIRKLVANTKPK